MLNLVWSFPTFKDLRSIPWIMDSYEWNPRLQTKWSLFKLSSKTSNVRTIHKPLETEVEGGSCVQIIVYVSYKFQSFCIDKSSRGERVGFIRFLKFYMVNERSLRNRMLSIIFCGCWGIPPYHFLKSYALSFTLQTSLKPILNLAIKIFSTITYIDKWFLRIPKHLSKRLVQFFLGFFLENLPGLVGIYSVNSTGVPSRIYLRWWCKISPNVCHRIPFELFLALLPGFIPKCLQELPQGSLLELLL